MPLIFFSLGGDGTKFFTELGQLQIGQTNWISKCDNMAETGFLSSSTALVAAGDVEDTAVPRFHGSSKRQPKQLEPRNRGTAVSYFV